MEPLARAHGFSALHYKGERASIWNSLPVSRRASVFILLFVGHLGELRVVLTKRSSQLRNFPGHISLPGGKADNGLESPWMVARREMAEEIGLSEDNQQLLRDHGFTIEPVTELPSYMSRTFSAVKPCVGFLRLDTSGTHSRAGTPEHALLSDLKLKVNPGESSSIFSCPLHDFLYPALDDRAQEAIERTHYKMKWGGIPWNLRSYTFPQVNPGEAPWLQGFHDLSASEESEVSEGEKDEGNGNAGSGNGFVGRSDSSPGAPSGVSKDSSVSSNGGFDNDSGEPKGEDLEGTPKLKKPKKDLSSWGKLGSRRDSVTNEKIYDVWGLTANILHDLAEVVYLSPGKKNPEKHFGEEELIWSVWHYGKQMRTKERSSVEAALIDSTTADPTSFGDILPRTEFNRLKRIYKI